MDKETLREILREQREATNTLLEKQQKFFKEIIDKQTNTSQQTSGQSAGVPIFHAFNKQLERWESYIEQLKQHLAAYSVTADKHKAFFLTWIGTDTYDILRSNFGAEEIEKKTFAELTEWLTEFFLTKMHVVAARHEFHKATMSTGQTYKEWIAELKRIARDCRFVCGETKCSHDYTQEMIRDKIIVHTPHDAVRAAALQKTNPSLAEVLQIAEAFEATEKTISKLKDVEKDKQVSVNAVKAKSKNKNKFAAKGKAREKSLLKSCAGCGSAHSRQQCKFRRATCNVCGKVGHISSVCMSASTTRNNNNNNNNCGNSEKLKKSADATHNCLSQIDSILSVNVQPRRENKKVFIGILINGISVKFQMDSGATVSVITEDTFEQLNKPKLRACEKQLFDYGQNQVNTLGEFSAQMQCGDMIKTATLVVACVRKGNNLFGTDLFDTFGFEISQIAAMEDRTHLNTILEKYQCVFEPALGTIKQVKASIHLKENAVPKFCKSRPIPYAQMDKFRAEAQRLTDSGIWKPVQFSEWASPIVLVNKPDGSLRICGDFKTTINKQIDVDQYPLPTRESLLHTVRYGKIFFENRSKRCVSTNGVGRRCQEVTSRQHTFGTFSIPTLTLWRCQCSSDVSEIFRAADTRY